MIRLKLNIFLFGNNFKIIIFLHVHLNYIKFNIVFQHTISLATDQNMQSTSRTLGIWICVLGLFIFFSFHRVFLLLLVCILHSTD